MLKLALGVLKVHGVLLDSEVTLVRLLDVVVPALVSSESNGILLGSEFDLSSLPVVSTVPIL